MIIGIIGKVGSGKSICAEYIREKYDAIVFSCDKIAKEMIENGEIDYKIENPYDFFTDQKKQEECRKIVHKQVFFRIKENISNIIEKNRIIIIETALPNEMLYNICDKVILIDNTYEKKLSILKEHRKYTDNQVKLIYDSQEYYEKFYNMASCKIENNGTKEDLYMKIKEVMDEICIIRK